MKLRLSCIDRNIIGVPGRVFRISRAASKPLSNGILMSKIITSGLSSFAFVTASLPFSASPHTSMSRRELRMEQTPFTYHFVIISNKYAQGKTSRRASRIGLTAPRRNLPSVSVRCKRNCVYQGQHIAEIRCLWIGTEVDNPEGYKTKSVSNCAWLSRCRLTTK